MPRLQANDSNHEIYFSGSDDDSLEIEEPLTQFEWEDYWMDHTRSLWESMMNYIQEYSIGLLRHGTLELFSDFVYHYSNNVDIRHDEMTYLTREEYDDETVRSLWSQVKLYIADYKIPFLTNARYDQFANFVYNNS